MIRYTSHCRMPLRRGAAIYSIVVGVSFLVAVLALAALNVVRIERRTSTTALESVTARMTAHAAAEMAIRDVQQDDSWRSRYVHNVETTTVTLGNGTASWKIKDTGDTSLTDDPWDSIEIVGIGRCGQAVWAESVQLNAIPREIGPTELRSYTSQFLTNSEVVNSGRWWAQYFKPTLPDRAEYWRVSQLQLYCRQASPSNSRSVNVQLQQPQSNWKPSGTVVDSRTFTGNSLPSSYTWLVVDYTATPQLDPATGLCITLTSPSNDVLNFQFRDGNANQSNSAMTRGTSTSWNSPDSDDCLLFRVNGYYTIAEMKVVPGSWKRTSL